jgi:hypothetical protein
MPTSTYVPLATITLSSTDSEIIFSSIPATYRDLILVAAIRNTGGSYDNVRIQFNSDTGSNYSYVQVFFNGSSAVSNSGTTNIFEGLTSSNTHNAAGIVQIMDYSATDKHKSVLTRGNTASSDNGNRMSASRWTNTAAINYIRLFGQTNSFASGSTFSLYGIAS